MCPHPPASGLASESSRLWHGLCQPRKTSPDSFALPASVPSAGVNAPANCRAVLTCQCQRTRPTGPDAPTTGANGAWPGREGGTPASPGAHCRCGSPERCKQATCREKQKMWWHRICWQLSIDKSSNTLHLSRSPCSPRLAHPDPRLPPCSPYTSVSAHPCTPLHPPAPPVPWALRPPGDSLSQPSAHQLSGHPDSARLLLHPRHFPAFTQAPRPGRESMRPC